MKKFFLLIVIGGIFLSRFAFPEEIALFTPPAKWHFTKADSLPTHVKVMVVGTGPSAFPPSMNLSSEPFKGTLRQYLNVIKRMNSDQGYEWKDLGSIQTEAGNANLSQVDTKTQWGDVRLMHVILKKNENIYILTASALKEEFPIFYKNFFAAMRSLKIFNNTYEMIADSKQRTELKTSVDELNSKWQLLLEQSLKKNGEGKEVILREQIFKNEAFQNDIWKPFQNMLKQKYGHLSSEWQTLFLQEVEHQLLNTQKEKL